MSSCRVQDVRVGPFKFRVTESEPDSDGLSLLHDDASGHASAKDSLASPTTWVAASQDNPGYPGMGIVAVDWDNFKLGYVEIRCQA